MLANPTFFWLHCISSSLLKNKLGVVTNGFYVVMSERTEDVNNFVIIYDFQSSFLFMADNTAFRGCLFFFTSLANELSELRSDKCRASFHVIAAFMCTTFTFHTVKDFYALLEFPRDSFRKRDETYLAVTAQYPLMNLLVLLLH